MRHFALCAAAASLAAATALASEPTAHLRDRIRLVDTKEAPQVLVHIDTDNTAVQMVRIAGTGYGTAFVNGQSATVMTVALENICRAPCDSTVSGGYNNQFMIVGDGVTPSSKFDFAGFNDSVNVKVKAGNAWGYWGGVYGTAMGFGAALTGGLLLGLSGGFGGGNPASGGSYETGIATMGLSFLIGGLVVGIPCVFLWINNFTDVKMQKGTGTPSPSVSPTNDVRASAPAQPEIQG